MGNYFMATHQDCPPASTDKAKGREPSISTCLSKGGNMLTGLPVGSEHPTLTEARVTLPFFSKP